MMVQRAERFEKSMDALRRGDGRAALAARNAEGIVRSLAAGNLSAVNHKLTCHGETRLDKAVKFDLGAGYRMVSVRSSAGFLMLFAGSHDDCDRWLERHRGSSFDPGAAAKESFPSPVAATADSAPEPDGDDYMEGEYECRLSQRELRHIFSGLWGGD